MRTMQATVAGGKAGAAKAGAAKAEAGCSETDYIWFARAVGRCKQLAVGRGEWRHP